MEDFDECARDCAVRYSKIVEQTRPVQEKLKKLVRVQKRIGRIGAALLFPLRFQIKNLQKDIQLQRRELRKIRTQLFELSKGRWFADPWYKASGKLPRQDYPVRKARYNSSGYFIMLPNRNKWGANYSPGQHNEFALYALLARAVQNGEFGYARLIPNAYIPVRPHCSLSHYKSCQPTYTEIDMILVTQHRVYCIETKYSGGAIDIRSKKGKFVVTAFYQDKAGRTTRKKLPVVEQNALHCQSLFAYLKKHGLLGEGSRGLDLASCDDSFPQSIIAFHEDNPKASSFCKGNSRALFSTDSPTCRYLPRVIKSKEKGAQRFSQAQVDAIADHLIQNNLDPTGQLKERLAFQIQSRKEVNKMISSLRKIV